MGYNVRNARNVDNGKKSPLFSNIRRPYGYKITRTYKADGREYQYHATKGWRSYAMKGEVL